LSETPASSRMFTIDFVTGTATTLTFFGERTGKIRDVSDQRYISFDLPIDADLQGKRVLLEAILINRFTGEASGVFRYVDSIQGGSRDILSFSGTCAKADRKF